jgi:hypothetical protein
MHEVFLNEVATNARSICKKRCTRYYMNIRVIIEKIIREFVAKN